MESITRKLSEFICQLSYEQIPTQAIQRIKISVLDALGCALSGAHFEWSKVVNDFVQSQQGVHEASLWATGFMGPAANVVLGNGTMIHSFDFDDYYHKAKLHTGAPVIPTALALGEKENIDGKKFITAVVAGFEIMTHIGKAINPAASRTRGWHLTGTCGTFGAAAAAGSVWDLDINTMVSALGMAGTQSAGLWAFTADGSESKRFHPGRAAQSGIIAASLALGGYQGPAKIIEAEDGGFFKATSHDFDFSKVTEGLGKKYDCQEVGIKPHAACASLHSSVDAALLLKKENNIVTEEIKKINVYNSELVNLQCGFKYAPLGALQAQMSMQYCVARALMDEMLYLSQFSEEALSEPAVLDLASRVAFVFDEEINNIYPREFPSIVEIIMNDGQKYKTRVNMPKGSLDNPMTWKDVQEKFTMLSAPVVGQKNVAAIIEMVDTLEKISDVTNITFLLKK
jgi:2-methylcitrate dehydratase PrpD